MRPILALLATALTLLTAAPALAAEKFIDDCTVAERNEPTLDRARLPSARFRMVVSDIGFERGKNNEQIRLKLRHGQETATLGGGVKLKVTLGWCENYSNAYQFQIAGDPTPISDTRYWLNRASRLIAEIAPASRESGVGLPVLGRALAREAKTWKGDLTQGLEGDLSETNYYLVDLARQGQTTTLKVTYIIRM